MFVTPVIVSSVADISFGAVFAYTSWATVTIVSIAMAVARLWMQPVRASVSVEVDDTKLALTSTFVCGANVPFALVVLFITAPRSSLTDSNALWSFVVADLMVVMIMFVLLMATYGLYSCCCRARLSAIGVGDAPDAVGDAPDAVVLQA